MKSIEKILYKIIVDLIITLQKYNITVKQLNVKVKSYVDLKTNQQPHMNMSYIFNAYNALTSNKNIDCEVGNDIYIDMIKLESAINSISVEYTITDILDNISISVKCLNVLSNSDTLYLLNQQTQIYKLLTMYKTIYNYVYNYSKYISAEFYSPCYAMSGWSLDSISDNKISIINRYNLYEIDINTIDNYEDKKIIKNILNI